MTSARPRIVYFIRPVGLEGPVKIGFSTLPPSRLEVLMSWAPVRLEIAVTIPGDISLERRIHGVFAASHSHHEWFFASPRLTELIRALIDGRPIGEMIDLNAPVAPFRVPTKRAPYSADRRRYLSFAARLRHALKPLWQAKKGGRFAPPDVREILDRWAAATGTTQNGREPRLPTPSEIDRVEQVIRNPELHATASWDDESPAVRAA